MNRYKVKFFKEPEFRPHPKGHKFQLTQDWFVEINDKTLIIPEGFWTDFASIPKFLHSFIGPLEEHLKAAILHDYLYYTGELFDKKCSRYDCDNYFMSAMKICGTGYCKRHIMYTGVRAGGWKPYNDYRSKDRIRRLVDAKKLIEKYKNT